ncbi:MAG TPA: hypothetical protein VFV38_50225 [Ktedonobacteraceae bacterium]|nr:hypothetical protein [Ktedonobacteraceae bacterium]
MKISKPLIYANITALSINGIIVWLVITKTFPTLLGILLVVGFLAGATWFSCFMNGALPKQRRQAFHSALTEKVEAV